MDSRLKVFTDSLFKNGNSKKRKYEGEKYEPPMKKPFLIRSRHDRVEEAKVAKEQPRGRQPKEQQKGHSANDRLQKLRSNIEQKRLSDESPNSEGSPSVPKGGSQVVRFSTSPSSKTSSSPGVSCNQKHGYIVTAKPSSLKERLNKIRNSESVQKFSSKNDKPQSSRNPVNKGWVKLVDVERKTHNDRKSGTGPSSQDRNKARLNRSVDIPLLSSKKFNKHSDVPVVCQSSYSTTSTNVVGDGGSVLTAPQSDNQIDDAMDWDPCDEKEVISNLQELRKTVSIAKAVPQSQFQEIIAKEAEEMPHNTALRKTIYIVVDTNIFLSQLETVRKAMKLRINGICTPIVFVPWIVIQELDYIKDGKHNYKLRNKAQQAIRFINECFSNKSNLKGQSIRDAAQQDFSSSNFDDSILHCCLQIRDRRNRAILLSNDVNLRNKLMNENFETYNQDTFFKKLDPFNVSFPKESNDLGKNIKETDAVKEMKNHLELMCTYIIMKELMEAYGDLWNKMGSARNPLPWTLENCLSLFTKFWIPVFQIKLHGLFLKRIDEFKKYLHARNGVVDDGEKLYHFGLALCIQCKSGYPSYLETVKECINNMEKAHNNGNSGSSMGNKVEDGIVH